MSRDSAGAAAPSRPFFLIALLALTAAGYLYGGARLLALGGSSYYLIGGLALLGAAVLLWRRDSRAAWLYVVFMAATLAWAFHEAGADGWALTPRLSWPAGIGIWFALPWVRRWLGGGAGAGAPGRSGSTACAALAVAALLLIALVALWPRTLPSEESFPAAPMTAATPAALVAPENGEWPAWGGTVAGTRFSPLTQLTRENVARLEPAWQFRTGVVQTGETSAMEATPLMVNGALYLCTQTNVVIALDPETGAEHWRHDPNVDPTGGSVVRTCRGVAYAEVAGAADCSKRIITATFDARLVAIDADTGKPCASFGVGGATDLKTGMGEVTAGFYYVSSAPTIVRNRIVLGGWVADNQRIEEPSGVVRAYDVATGAFAWAWDLGRPGQHGEPGPGETYTRGTPNAWGPFSGDEELGLVYVPTGNATPDHWGGHRSKLMDQYSTSTVALDAETGEPRWSFQAVHHDLWDYDNPAQPTLIDVNVGGRRVPAVIQPTKTGQTFLLDRRDGTPLAKVEERPVPHDAAPGDRMAPTQPFSAELPTFDGPRLTERDMWGITPFDHLWCRIHFRGLRYEGMFTPVGLHRTTLIYPGIGGGINWGGVSVDADRGVMLVNSLRIGTVARLLTRAEEAAVLQGTSVAKGQVHKLRGPIPQGGTPYAVAMDTFVSPLGVPCNEPPYGVMSAVDLNTRKLFWEVPLGAATDTGPFQIPHGLPFNMGLPNWGGSVTTRSGLVFIAGTHERAIRAYDIRTGEILWKARLPVAGVTVPMTYISPRSGRQFVVTIAGGHRTLQAPLGDYVQAYALPKDLAR